MSNEDIKNIYMFVLLILVNFCLISEPIVSMGNWNKPETRQSLAKRERDTPSKIFDKIILDSGFVILKKNFLDKLSPSSVFYLLKRLI